MIGYLVRNTAAEARDLLRRLPRVFLSGFGIFFLIVLLVVFVSMRRSVTSYLEKRIFGSLKINEIAISPRAGRDVSVGMFAPSSGEITAAQLRALRRVEGLSGVREIYRFSRPAMLRIDMFGRSLRTDILVSGVEKEFFAGSPFNWRQFRDADPVPMVVPYFALELYNNFASTSGLPRFSERDLAGVTAEMSLGESSFFRGGKSVRCRVSVLGFSARLSTTGVVLPVESLRRSCAQLVMPGEAGCLPIVMAYASVKDPNRLPETVDRIRRLGLSVESRRDIAEKTGKAVLFIDAVFALLFAMIAALTAVAIFNSYLSQIYHRRDEIALKRIVGVSRVRVLVSYLIEAALAGALYGVIGYWGGLWAVGAMNTHLPRLVPVLAGFELSTAIEGLLPVSVAVSSAVSALSALIPSIIAANLSLFSTRKV